MACKDGGRFGIACFAGGAAAGGDACHVQVHQQIVAAEVTKGEAGVVGQSFGGMAGQAAVVWEGG
jgi:hypothetical protein